MICDGYSLTTTVSAGRSMSIRAPGDVNPGAIILAPLRINFIAPLSTCSFGNKFGSEIMKYVACSYCIKTKMLYLNQ